VLAAELQMKSGCGAALVRQRRLIDEYVCLTFVHFRHRPAARGKALLDAVDDRLLDAHLQPERLLERLARQIILGRPESAADEQDVGAIE